MQKEPAEDPRDGRGCALDVESASRCFGYRFVYPIRGYDSQDEVDGGPRGRQGRTVNPIINIDNSVGKGLIKPFIQSTQYVVH